MTTHADFDAEIEALWGEANGMIQANRLDSKRAGVLQKLLKECAESARDAGYGDRERLLRRAAAELAERFLSPEE
jgi:hypothetical protein